MFTISTLLHQELFKMSKKKSTTYIIPIALFLLTTMVSFMYRGSSDATFYVSSAFAGFQWTSIIIIVISATTIANEFQYGTIKQMIYEVNNRSIIYISKLIIIILYSVYLHILNVIFTTVLNFLVLGNKPNLGSEYMQGKSLFVNLVMNSSSDLLGSLLMIVFVFLIASLSNNGAVAIAFGLGLGFFGQGIGSILNNLLFKVMGFIKWNPFNMFNLTNQLTNASYQASTHLSNVQLFTGNIIYIIIFLIIGLILFNKRRV